jgi:hypothetical protein
MPAPDKVQKKKGFGLTFADLMRKRRRSLKQDDKKE